MATARPTAYQRPLPESWRELLADLRAFVDPLLNDTDPGGESEPLRLADVQQVADATVVPDYDAGTFRFSAESAQARKGLLSNR